MSSTAAYCLSSFASSCGSEACWAAAGLPKRIRPARPTTIKFKMYREFIFLVYSFAGKSVKIEVIFKLHPGRNCATILGGGRELYLFRCFDTLRAQTIRKRLQHQYV